MDGVPAARSATLTDREREVLTLRAAGRTVADIAHTLTVEPRTVKFHLRNVYAKLGLRQHTHGARQMALARFAEQLKRQSAATHTQSVQEAPAIQSADEAPDTPLSRRHLFRPDRTLTQVLARGRFTLSAEVIPPRNGAEQTAVLANIARLIDSGAQFLAVTKGAGGSLRGGSLPIAQVIKEQFGVPCIAHFTCRDLLPEEVENQLMDHHYFGIRNILALRGDPPDGQPAWQPRPGGYRYAHQLIDQIRRLNRGDYLVRPNFPPTPPGQNGPQPEAQSPTDFCIGCAVYPEHPDPQQRIDFFKRKRDAGAEFAITQMVFDPDAYGRFLDTCERSGLDVPILPGTRILRSRVSARRTAEKYAVSVPEATMRSLRSLQDPDAKNRALDLFLSVVDRLRHLGAPGIHIFVTDTTIACQALSLLAPTGKH
jgi:methylenetetrahydrofolate reductase (NADPH)